LDTFNIAKLANNLFLIKMKYDGYSSCYVQRNEGKGEDLNAGSFNEMKINTT